MSPPTKLAEPLTIEAVAVCGPAPMFPPSAFTVIVSTWLVPVALVSFGGLISIHASTHFFEALSHGF